MKRRKTQKEMWKFIHEPKIQECTPIFDENGKLITVGYLLDRIPVWWREKNDKKV